jgi:hypothetical protein
MWCGHWLWLDNCHHHHCRRRVPNNENKTIFGSQQLCFFLHKLARFPFYASENNKKKGGAGETSKEMTDEYSPCTYPFSERKPPV